MTVTQAAIPGWRRLTIADGDLEVPLSAGAAPHHVAMRLHMKVDVCKHLAVGRTDAECAELHLFQSGRRLRGIVGNLHPGPAHESSSSRVATAILHQLYCRTT